MLKIFRYDTSPLIQMQKRFATKKMGSSKARQKRSPDGKRLGLKKYEGEPVKVGNIIVRQRGTKNHPGDNVALGRDHTIYALKPGYVHFSEEKSTGRKLINIVEFDPAVVKPPTQAYWTNDAIFTRDSNGERIFNLTNLNELPPVEPSDLAAVEFDAMAAHLKAMNLTDKLGSVEGYCFGDRFKAAVSRGNAAE